MIYCIVIIIQYYWLIICIHQTVILISSVVIIPMKHRLKPAGQPFLAKTQQLCKVLLMPINSLFFQQLKCLPRLKTQWTSLHTGIQQRYKALSDINNIIFYSSAVPKVEIVDERGVSVSDKFYKEGSIIELRCVITRVPQPSGQVLWSHQGRQLNYDTKRGGIRFVFFPKHITFLNRFS